MMWLIVWFIGGFLAIFSEYVLDEGIVILLWVLLYNGLLMLIAMEWI